MMNLKKSILSLLPLFLFTTMWLEAQFRESNPNPELLSNSWEARWIVPPDTDVKGYGVFHYRKTFYLAELPGSFIINVSADNRYKLYVNGEYVCNGPARGDLAHWRFETVDIAPALKTGKNVIAAVVWNFGIYAPLAQITEQTGFILQGNSNSESIVNTDSSWLIYKNRAYTAIPFGPRYRGYFYVTGPGEHFNADIYPWGWEQLDYDDSKWLSPDNDSHQRILYGRPAGTRAAAFWQMVPRDIPFMEYKQQRFYSIRRAAGIEANPGFLEGKSSIIIPENSSVAVLIDQRVLTTAYPEIIFSGGENSSIMITYAEALSENDKDKGNRNEMEGKHITGNYDIIIPDGGKRKTFQTLWYRTFRYVQLDIETKDEPLILHDIFSYFTAYPLEKYASFSSNRVSLDTIWEIGWRTARLCANETYMDCPYYEQLNYAGDTRVQALISYYVAGENRLAKNAIMQFLHSQKPGGMIQCCYPAKRELFHPDYSIHWIGMIYDYWMHYNDTGFIKQILPSVAKVLKWFEDQVNEDGMLNILPYSCYIDSRYRVDIQKAEADIDTNNAINTLLYVYGLQMASDMFQHFGFEDKSNLYLKRACELKNTVYKTCFNERRGLLAETPNLQHYSQHVNILGVLTDAIPKEDQKVLMEKVLSDDDLIKCNYFFTFYLGRSLKKAGLGHRYLELMQPWYDMMELGLTTFREAMRGNRSDCHAWSSSPMYEFLTTICGIEPAESGFRSVVIEPHLGELTEVSGEMPHYMGNIQVVLKRQEDKGVIGEITLPERLTGEFRWGNKVIKLTPGIQEIKLEI